jgi:O-antigen ligase
VLEYLKSEKQLLIVLLLWVFAGTLYAPLTWGVIPLTLLLFQRRKMYTEMLIGFFVILSFSDSRQQAFLFAADIKDIYLVILAVFMLIDRQAFAPRQRLIFRFIPFFVVAVLCLIFSTVFLTSVQKTLSYVLLFMVVPNYIVYGWKTEGENSIRKFIWTGVTLLAVGFIFRFISPAFVTLAGRYSGMLGNPNGLGLYCIVFFILTTVANDIRKTLFTKRQLYLIQGVILLSILLSGSRNAVFTIGIFMLFRYFYKISPFLGISAFLVIIIVYQLILANLGNIIVALDLQEYFRIETLESASGRLVAWNFGWEKIMENPLIGKGIGHGDNLYKVNYAFLSIQGHQGNAHNSFITFWLDTGFFGLLFYLIAFIQSFIVGAKYCRSAIPALFAILFSAFFESWLTASLNPFTIQCVIIMTLISAPAIVGEPATAEHAETEEELESEENNSNIPAST